jgi:putative ABC transport system permease protein
MLSFTWKDLLHHRNQTIFNVLGLAVGVFSYLVLVTLAETMDTLVKENNLSRNLVILQQGNIMMDESNISAEVLNTTQALIPGTVKRIAPVLFRLIQINNELVQLRAVPITDWEAVFNLKLMEGGWPAAQDEVAIGEGLKIAVGWEIGTILNIYGRDFRIAGVFQSPGTVFASVWMPLETARELFAPNNSVQMLVLQPASGSDPEATRLKLEQDPHLAGGYTIFYEDDLAKSNARTLHVVAVFVRIVATIALVSIIFGTYNLTSLSLEERRREAGILRALSFSPLTIRAILALQALLLGLSAFLSGLTAAWVYTIFESKLAPIYLTGFPVIFQLSMTNTLVALAWMLALPMLGAWLATRQLLRDSVVFSLKRN